MIIEALIEQSIIDALQSEFGDDVQLVGSRLETKIEDADKKTIIAVASGFRTHDAFSLSLVNVPVAISIATRVEGDAQSQEHNATVEKIVDILVDWHKHGDIMESALSNEKFLAGELRMDGGTTQTFDRDRMIWTDAININIRGSEKFPEPPRMTTIVKYDDGRSVELDIQGELGSDSIPDREYISELDIGNAVTNIGERAFDSCAYLENVIIPESVETIGTQGFSRTRQLTSITIKGNGLKVIGVAAFGAITSLTSISLPDSVVSIGRSAFEDCVSLTSIDIPASVQTMDREVFLGCSGLTSVTFSGKDKATVQGMSNYRWDLPSGCVLHCTDGDITL